VALSGWIISIVYARGEFNDADAALVANVQRAFVLQVPFYVVGIFCWRMLNALGEWKPLLLATLPALVLDIAVVSKLASEYHSIGVAGSYTLSIVVWALILFLALRNKLKSPSC
jgi:peptidoglycan biosynthesis protein MviN/MurJ (putative lipid II flippase)